MNEMEKWNFELNSVIPLIALITVTLSANQFYRIFVGYFEMMK